MSRNAAHLAMGVITPSRRWVGQQSTATLSDVFLKGLQEKPQHLCGEFSSWARNICTFCAVLPCIFGLRAFWLVWTEESNKLTDRKRQPPYPVPGQDFQKPPCTSWSFEAGLATLRSSLTHLSTLFLRMSSDRHLPGFPGNLVHGFTNLHH